jgi:hypothetical protein
LKLDVPLDKYTSLSDYYSPGEYTVTVKGVVTLIPNFNTPVTENENTFKEIPFIFTLVDPCDPP